MKSPPRRSVCHGALASLMLAGALGCTPEINIGALSDVSSEAATGGSSAGGPCGITMLASGLDQPWFVTMYRDTVYVATGSYGSSNAGSSNIVKVPLTGGTPVVIAATPGTTWTLATDGSVVYWSVFEQAGIPPKLFKVPVWGGPLTEVPDGLNVTALTLDSTNLYWVTVNGTVKKAPIEGGATTTFDVASASSGGSNILVDATNIYWMTNEGSVRKMPVTGGEPTTLAVAVATSGSIAVDATHVYWANGSGPQARETVLKAPIDGSAPPEMMVTASGDMISLGTGSSFAVTDGYVYWVGGGALRRMPALGGDPEVFVTPTTTFHNGIVACPGGVCWTDSNQGTLMRFVACSP